MEILVGGREVVAIDFVEVVEVLQTQLVLRILGAAGGRLLGETKRHDQRQEDEEGDRVENKLDERGA